MIPIMILTLSLTLISFIANRKKTIIGIRKGLKQFLAILPTLLSVIILISIVLYFVSDELLMEYMGEKAGWGAYFAAALIGSVSILPGFIAYPLSGILVQTGVSLSVIAVFITTLKMVGILTIPIEKRYFGLKVAIIRNLLSFIGAIVVGAIMALILNII
jgi:uncharacterized membrane protein YraQ (UPF0718 family)